MTDPRSEGLIRGAYRATLLLAGIGLLALLGSLRWDWISSYAAGVGLSLGSLRLLEWLVPRFLEEHDTRTTGLMAAVLVGKYLLIAVLFFLLARQGWLHIPAFVAGFALLHGVLVVRFWAAGGA